jgi:hypothetical protein
MQCLSPLLLLLLLVLLLLLLLHPNATAMMVSGVRPRTQPNAMPHAG